MLALGTVLGDAFAQAAVVIPEGLVGPASETGDTSALAKGLPPCSLPP